MATTISPLQRMVPGLIEKVGGQAAAGIAPPVSGEGKFSEMLTELIDAVDQTGKESAQLQQAFLAGDPVELHQVMIKAEEAGISMDLLLEIRNKLMDAYNTIMRMPM